MRAEDITAKKFGTTKWREGYDMDQVDDLLARATATLAAYERGDAKRPALTADDVVKSRFNQTKFRAGYDQDHVDDFLDEVIIALRTREQG